jgi:hypothetical protein
MKKDQGQPAPYSAQSENQLSDHDQSHNDPSYTPKRKRSPYDNTNALSPNKRRRQNNNDDPLKSKRDPENNLNTTQPNDNSDSDTDLEPYIKAGLLGDDGNCFETGPVAITQQPVQLPTPDSIQQPVQQNLNNAPLMAPKVSCVFQYFYLPCQPIQKLPCVLQYFYSSRKSIQQKQNPLPTPVQQPVQKVHPLQRVKLLCNSRKSNPSNSNVSPKTF